MGPITTMPDLQTHLQNAVKLEFATIPPYLCGQWTIKDQSNQCAQLVQGVAVAEMRHMTIVANCLIATGSTPNILAVPTYPSYLPDGETEFEVSLLPFGLDFLTQGMKIEDPSPKVISAKIQDLVAQRLAIPRRHRLLAMGNRYPTIGEFYKAIIQGIQTLIAQSGEKGVFPNNGSTNQQVATFQGKNVTISNSIDAITLLTDVIDEGEGASGAMWDENGNLAHYYVFQEMSLGKLYVQGDMPGKPTGAAIDVPAVAGVFQMLPNPKMEEYPPTSKAWNDAKAFNDQFKTLVTDLQSAFTSNPSDISKAIFSDMLTLPDAAQTLFNDAAANQPELVAGPTFELPSG